MEKMEVALKNRGYKVINMNYPSRKHPIEALSKKTITQALTQSKKHSPDKIHFVTHSMGGILIRHYLQKNTMSNLGKIVMLSPPNQGSEVVDKLSGLKAFQLLNGPAGSQLGTDSQSIPLNLDSINAEVGVITGNRSINPLLSMLIPGANDGKVSGERARLEGMSGFLVVPHAHPFIMRNNGVIDQVIYFLKYGKFKR